MRFAFYLRYVQSLALSDGGHFLDLRFYRKRLLILFLGDLASVEAILIGIVTTGNTARTLVTTDVSIPPLMNDATVVGV